jgi:hypothetical protein
MVLRRGPIRRQNTANQALKEKIELQQQIARLTKQLLDKEEALGAPDSSRRNVDATPTQKQHVPKAPPDTTFSPHGLIPRVPRPQDVAYQEALKRGTEKEIDQTIDAMENF